LRSDGPHPILRALRESQIGETSPAPDGSLAWGRGLNHSRSLTISDVADYLQVFESFVDTEIHMDKLDAIYIGCTGVSKLLRLLSTSECSRRFHPCFRCEGCAPPIERQAIQVHTSFTPVSVGMYRICPNRPGVSAPHALNSYLGMSLQQAVSGRNTVVMLRHGRGHGESTNFHRWDTVGRPVYRSTLVCIWSARR
jgi:hypothetical protein